jgi:UDPglucose 6-dehydrogenase/GDP-mannose 6-dehydrogenase
MKVCVFGAGYVGVVSGAGLSHVGHDVTIVDTSAPRIDSLRAAKSPFLEPGLDDLLREGLSTGRLHVTMDPQEALEGSDVSLIAVGTPSRDGEIDLTAVLGVARTIGAWLTGAGRRHTVVVKSTVVPGTTDGPVRTALEESSHRKAGTDFGLGINPEFLREGSAVCDFLNPDRIVLGGSDARSTAAIAELYASFSCPKLEVAPVNAELIKYASNALLSTLVSFSNEWAAVCEGLPGADVQTMMRGIHLDRRLARGENGEPIRPGILAYLAAGPGFGGSCLPKDLAAARSSAGKNGVATPLLDAVARVNEERPAQVIAILKRELGGLEGRTVAVLGLAFKPGTDDTRDSPALPLLRLLESERARTRVWDPMAANGATPAQRCSTPEELLSGADAAILVTAWPEIARWPWHDLLPQMKSRTIVDARNALRSIQWPDGVRYIPIGRGPELS